MKDFGGCTLKFGATLLLLVGISASAHTLIDPHSERLQLAQGKPFVMVMVNGKGPFRFIVDTGTSGEAIVTSELVDRLGLPFVGQTRLSDPSGKGVRYVPIVQIQSLVVAGIEFTGLKAAVHRLGSEDLSYDGLLGFALFRDYLLTLDFKRRELTLESGALVPDGEQSVLSFRMPDGLPIVPIRIGDLRIDAQIDSGGMGLTLPENFASRMVFASDPIPLGYIRSLSTRFQINEAKLASDVHLGEYTFRQPFVEIDRAFPLANLGSSPMQSFAVTFDQKNSLVQFKCGQKRLSIVATRTPIRLLNAPIQAQPDPTLFPAD
jgi:predicted aspartyl protease